MMKWLALVCALSLACFGQQAQTHDVPSGALNPEPIFGANSKWVQGIGPGYWPTAGTGLTLNLTAGTVWCLGTVRTYAGGTLTMTNSATNYVYLDTSSNCVPASSSSIFTGSQIPVAVVTASGGAITVITDPRNVMTALSIGLSVPTGLSVSGSPVINNGTFTVTWSVAGAGYLLTSTGVNAAAWHQVNGGADCGDSTHSVNWTQSTQLFGCQLISQPCPTLTGDVTSVGCATTLVNIPDGTTMAGKIVATDITAPATPASGKDNLYVDSTDKRFHDKNDAGTIGTTAVAKTAGSHKWFSAMSAAGAFTDTQPACGDLSDAGAGCNGSSGPIIKVNTAAIAGTNANLSDSTPAAASNHVNVTWQKDSTTPDTNISAQVSAATDTVLGVLKSITCTNQFIRSFTTGTGAASCDTVGTNDLAANAVNSAKSAVVNTRRTCMMVMGADNASAVLANSDLGPQLDQCQMPYAATVVEIDVMADAGTPNVIVQRSHLGSATALLSSALATASAGAVACSNTGGTTGFDGTTTCTNTLQNTAVAVGDWIGLTSGTAGGTAKRMSIAVHMTVN